MKLQNTNQIIPHEPTSCLYSVCSTLVFIHFDLNYSFVSKFLLFDRIEFIVLRSKSLHYQVAKMRKLECEASYMFLYIIITLAKNDQETVVKIKQFFSRKKTLKIKTTF